MTKKEKIEFVKTLLEVNINEIVKKIELDIIPENWEGIELREYMAYVFQGFKMGNYYWKKNQSRRRDYNNDLLTRNL